MKKKNHTFYIGKSPFSSPWNKNFRWKQQNSLIGGDEDFKNVYMLKNYTLGVLVDLNFL